MRRAALLLGVVLAACELPEDRYVLSGRVTSPTQPVAGATVRLLREQVASPERCSTLAPLLETTTDEEGRYRFELIRQQVTLGVPERRFFRVEAQGTTTASFTFWFPAADAPLPDLPLAAVDPGPAMTVFTELLADGRVVQRAGPPIDRPALRRTVVRKFEQRRFEIDSLGRADEVPFELRFEQEPTLVAAGPRPESRGAACPGLGAGECLLTDGRFLPIALPPDTRALVIDLGRERIVDVIRVHGLLPDGNPVKLVAEHSFEGPPTWSPFNSARLDASSFGEGRTHCQEPGSSFEVNVSVGRFPRPRWLRLTFPDAEGKLVRLLSVQEVVVP